MLYQPVGVNVQAMTLVYKFSGCYLEEEGVYDCTGSLYYVHLL